MAHRIVSGAFVEMTRHTHSNRIISWGSLVLVIFALNVVQAGKLETLTPQVIEIFTTTDSFVAGVTAISQQYRGSAFHVYELDGIQRIEARLSKDLSPDPKLSKHIVLQRIQQLDDTNRARMQRTAVGLSKAVQYGIDRYPAIVFDGQAVVYGLTDLKAALQHYRAWRTGSLP